MFARKHLRGQAIAAGVLLVMIFTLLAAGIADLYRLREARNWGYRAAESAALAGVTLGRDLTPVYDPARGEPRVDPTAGHSNAEAALLDALSRRGVAGATYRIEVLEWGGTINGYPPVDRADLMTGASTWTSSEPAVGVYLEIPVNTTLLRFVLGDRVAVHVFAAAGVSDLN